jgi:uncharacterized membrane protein YheB (UPF0754 family)
MMHANAGEIVYSQIWKEGQQPLDYQMCELLQDQDEQITQLRSSAISLYQHVITDRLPGILHAIDVSKMIENCITEMDMAKVEHPIYEVMNKELKAIVWLGAFLGAIMGMLNLMLIHFNK